MANPVLLPRPRLAVIVVPIAAVLLLAPGLAHSQAGWRTDGTGRYPSARPPASWGPDNNVIWKTPLGGWSNASPVPAKGKIFVCREVATLLCVDRATGKILWEAGNGYGDVFPADEAARIGALPVTYQNVNGYSTPTPVVGGEAVYALFGNGVASAYDLSGRRLWARFLNKSTHGWGHSASPVVADGTFVAHVGNTVTALDAKTGAVAWQANGGQNWGTPLVLEMEGGKAVLTTGGDVFRLKDGKVLARTGGLPWTSPVADNGVIFLVDENGAYAWRLPKKIQDPLPLEKAWENLRYTRDRFYASPLVHEGIVYAVTQRGWMTALDAATGAVVWSQNVSLGGTLYPSPCLAGGRIYVSSDTGETVVLAPGREYKVLGRMALEPFRSNPVFDGDRVYIRGLTHLWCLGNK